MKSLPPLVSTIHDQTGIRPPSWLLDVTGMTGNNGNNGNNGTTLKN